MMRAAGAGPESESTRHARATPGHACSHAGRSAQAHFRIARVRQSEPTLFRVVLSDSGRDVCKTARIDGGASTTALAGIADPGKRLRLLSAAEDAVRRPWAALLGVRCV